MCKISDFVSNVQILVFVLLWYIDMSKVENFIKESCQMCEKYYFHPVFYEFHSLSYVYNCLSLQRKTLT